MSLLSYTTQKQSLLTLIEGSLTDLNWASLGADYVLGALMESHKYSRVVVVTFDRPKIDIVTSCKGLQGDDPRAEEKLSVIEALDVTAGDSSLNFVYDEVEQVCLESGNSGMVGILLYSISSVCLSKGWGSTKRFLDKLTAFVKGSINPEANEGSNSREFMGRGTVIGTVHGSLHSRQQLTMLRALADTYCGLSPNSGSLSSVVAAEAHIIRRSATATGGVGRVSEAHELFMFEAPVLAEGAGARRGAGKRQDLAAQEWVPMRLVSLPKVGEEQESHQEDTHADDEGDYAADTVLQTMLGKAGVTDKGKGNGNGNGSGGGGGEESKPKSQATVQANQRLVTFSSTDQEFDEDSDPDADLDL